MSIIYLVLPCYNEEAIIKDSAIKLKRLMEDMISSNKVSEKSRIVFVNDGSTDNTWSLIEEICIDSTIFGAISLSSNRGHQNALLAGIMSVKDECDAVITLDADLQHDIEMIPQFVMQYEAGNDIVYGIRKSRGSESLFKQITGNLFYDVMGVFGANIIKNHADYRLMSRRAINALSRYDEVNLFLRGIITQLGFPNTTLEYEEKPRLAGESKYSLKKMVGLASDGITSFSIKPLQIISFLGALFFLFSIIMFIYAVVVFALEGTVPGWTSIVAPIWLLGGIQLLSLGVVGEYIGKIYMETKHRPKYEIEKDILHK